MIQAPETKDAATVGLTGETDMVFESRGLKDGAYPNREAGYLYEMMPADATVVRSMKASDRPAIGSTHGLGGFRRFNGAGSLEQRREVGVQRTRAVFRENGAIRQIG